MQIAYKTHLKSKAAFCELMVKTLMEGYISENDFDFQTLEKEADEYLNRDIEIIPFVYPINFTEKSYVRGETIFSKKIRGKSDVDIAKMIQHLENSDWV